MEEPESDDCGAATRSPKRQSSTTVLDKVKAKLSRSLSLSSGSYAAAAALRGQRRQQQQSQQQQQQQRPRRDPSPPAAVQVQLRQNGGGSSLLPLTREKRRCKSEVTSPNTAELLARFVAHRAGGPTLHDDQEAPLDASLASGSLLHSPLPRTDGETTQNILSVDKATGIIAVNRVSNATF